MTTYDSIGFIIVCYNPKEKAESFFNNKFLAINNRDNINTFCITFIHGFNVISISTDICKAEQIPCGFVRI